jgi:CBS domain-containing protein
MNASAIMVSDVITMKPDDTVQDVAGLLLVNRISGVPVVDGSGKIVGIVSEGDLLRRSENRTEHERPWWLKLLMGRELLAAEFIKEYGRKVADVMTREVISAAPDTPVADIATLLELVEARHLPHDFRAHIAAAQPAASAFMVHLGIDFVPDIKPTVQASGDPRVGIEALSLVDQTAAPPGHATIGIIAVLPHAQAVRWFPAQGADDWKEWRHSAEYEGRMTASGDRMIVAAEKVIPKLSRHIVYRTDASPVTDARYDWTSVGAI